MVKTPPCALVCTGPFGQNVSREGNHDQLHDFTPRFERSTRRTSEGVSDQPQHYGVPAVHAEGGTPASLIQQILTTTYDKCENPKLQAYCDLHRAWVCPLLGAPSRVYWPPLLTAGSGPRCTTSSTKADYRQALPAATAAVRPGAHGYLVPAVPHTQLQAASAVFRYRRAYGEA